jgi:hypothetical protein
MRGPFPTVLEPFASLPLINLLKPQVKCSV